MTSNKRVLAAWANAFADWEEGVTTSPSGADLIRLYETIIGKLAVDPEQEFFDRMCDGDSLEGLLDFLDQCEHVQPLQPIVRFEVIQVNGKRLWTVLKWENDHCKGGDHHWIYQETAKQAQVLYTRVPELHGMSETTVLANI